MKAVRILISLLILSWIAGAATLHLKKREIRPEGRVVGVIESPGPRWMGGRSHLILKFRHAVNEEMLQELNRRGAYVVGSVPDFGVTITAPDNFSLEALDVEWTGRLGLDDKISPILQDARSVADIWFVAEFFSDMDMQEARRLAEAAGFRVHEHPDLIAWHLLLSGSPGRLAGLAQWDEVAYLFPASRALVRGEPVGHCAGALTAGGVTPMYVTASSGWPKDKGTGQVTLSYVFGKTTPNLDSAQANQEILRALNAWTQYAPVKFVAGQSATAPRTVYVSFLSRDHGDGYPFDGPGGILAHTFYPAPPNQESLAGDMHLDADENWHIGANTDLFTVAVHEAGHALGLAHVDNASAVMYPYYRLGSKISADDIAGVQSLYGGPGGTSAPITATAGLGLTISTPGPNTSTSGSTAAVAGTTTGGQGTVQVTWQTDHGSSGIASGAVNWSAAAVALALGSNTITVTAADSSHKAVQTVNVTRTPQPANPPPGSPASGTPPTLSITSPAGSVVTTSAGVIVIKGTATDSAGISKVTWQSAAGSGTAIGTTSWTASSVPLLVGNNTIIVRAYDPGGNMSWRSVLVIRY